jgi:hypothetical protein
MSAAKRIMPHWDSAGTAACFLLVKVQVTSSPAPRLMLAGGLPFDQVALIRVQPAGAVSVTS